MKPARSIRGAALPETAIVLTATLAMFFGIIQIGVIGFLQIMVDGAAFVAAHEYALLNTTTYMTVAERPFPLLTSASFASPGPVTNSSDKTSVPVNYNTSATTARQGGVSLVRRNHSQISVSKSAPGGLLGVGIAALSGIKVQAAAIEPNSQVSNDVYDVNAAGYSGGGGTNKKFFGDVQDGPANYLSNQTMSYCNSSTPSSGTHFGTGCPSSLQSLRTLGSAVFLDHDNWNRTNLGMGTYSGGYTFAEMLCHEQMYAAAAATFTPAAAATAMPQINVSTLGSGSTTLDYIYSWDYVVSNGGGYTATEVSYNQYPLHPYQHCP